jgi:hypothetical protein
LISRNYATTFTGLCGDHDREIFKPIDTNDINADDPQHLFLLAYRPVLRELHATIEGAAKIQGLYEKRVELGLDPEDQPSPAGMVALSQMLKSERTFRYKFEYDQVYMSKSYNSICHETRLFDMDRPTLAASTLFSTDNTDESEKHIQCIALNVLPVSSEKTLVVISWLPRDTEWVQQKFQDLLNSEGHYGKYILSKTILNYSENFVLSPSYFDEWSNEKRDAIQRYYVDTLIQSDIGRENEHLYLF